MIEISNPDKEFFPRDGITKSDVVAYYRDVAQTMLPHIRDRPLMMHRFPDGIGKKGFYQKQIGDYFPDWIDRLQVSKEGGSTEHVVCNNAAMLAYIANQACISPHVWLSRVDRLKHPDQLGFDLDPPGEDFELVRFAAQKLHELLDELDLPGYLKTTGSRGLHVVVPLDRSGDYGGVRKLARDIASLLADRESERLTVEQRKNKRHGRLYLDTGRNAYAQTVVAPYALRPRPGAPVSTPLDWEEIRDKQIDAQSYTIKNIFRRLGQKEDPWSHIRRRAVSLAAARKRLSNLA